MEKFTASNGTTIWESLTGRTVQYSNGYRFTIADYGIRALREFFRAEEDGRLGRWRWPENPDYVVYPSENECTIIRESDGDRSSWKREWAAHGINVKPSHRPAARAYFEAHPERRPWEDAKPGEVWAVTLHGKERPCKVVETAYSEHAVAFLPLNEPSPTWFVPSAAITEARRIWPEGD